MLLFIVREESEGMMRECNDLEFVDIGGRSILLSKVLLMYCCEGNAGPPYLPVCLSVCVSSEYICVRRETVYVRVRDDCGGS